MSRNPLHTRLVSIVEPVCRSAGFELVDLRFVLEHGGWVLRVCVDHDLSRDDCPGFHQIASLTGATDSAVVTTPVPHGLVTGATVIVSTEEE